MSSPAAAGPLGYVSTRGAAPRLTFDDVLLAGLARDGGLYVPEHWPVLDGATLRSLAGATYAEAATTVMAPFVAGSSFGDDEFAACVAGACAAFEHPDVVPLRDLGDGLWLAELFWGPTLAFKDVALQLVGRLFDAELRRRGQRVTVIGATSGDTGSAAIEALAGRESVEVVILHPAGRVSEVQRRQMTTVTAPNVHCVAVEGTFDDCQDLVKALFADEDFRDRHHLSAVNSINWARVLAQSVYYVTAAVALGAPERPVNFVVPTGNFGNVYAGYASARRGLPVGRLVVASNRNDILTRFFTTGTMTIAEVRPTASPSMDIQVSSNLERLLWEVLGRDGTAVADLLAGFRATGTATVDDGVLAALRARFDAGRCDEAGTAAVMRSWYERAGLVLDPHTAVGVGVAEAARARGLDEPVVVLATAHPAKFPDAVEAATGVRPALPERLADLLDRPERVTALPNKYDAVAAFVAAHSATASG